MVTALLQPLASRMEGMPIVDEHALLDDNKYIADVLADFRTGKVPPRPAVPAETDAELHTYLKWPRRHLLAPIPINSFFAGKSTREARSTTFLRAQAGREFASSKLLFKKRMFRETDETILESVFISLSYVQAQHDYLQVRDGLSHGAVAFAVHAFAALKLPPQISYPIVRALIFSPFALSRL